MRLPKDFGICEGTPTPETYQCWFFVLGNFRPPRNITWLRPSSKLHTARKLSDAKARARKDVRKGVRKGLI